MTPCSLQFKRISMNDEPENVDLTGSAPSVGCWKETWECGNGEPPSYENDFLDARPSSAFNNAEENIANEYSEDAPGSEMYSAEVIPDILFNVAFAARHFSGTFY